MPNQFYVIFREVRDHFGDANCPNGECETCGERPAFQFPNDGRRALGLYRSLADALTAAEADAQGPIDWGGAKGDLDEEDREENSGFWCGYAKQCLDLGEFNDGDGPNCLNYEIHRLGVLEEK